MGERIERYKRKVAEAANEVGRRLSVRQQIRRRRLIFRTRVRFSQWRRLTRLKILKKIGKAPPEQDLMIHKATHKFRPNRRV